MGLKKEEASLLEIQEIDIKVAQLTEKAEKAPHRQRVMMTRAKIAEGQKRLELIEAARGELESKITVLEQGVDDFNRHMKSHQKLMQGSSDHREVQNFATELESLMKQKEKRENEGMNLMERRAEFGEAHKDTADKTNQLKEVEAQEVAAYEKYFAELKETHKELTARRAELAENVKPANLERYEAVRDAKNGIGIALYENGKCGGCQVLVPDAQRAEIEFARGLATCPSCKRLLVVDK